MTTFISSKMIVQTFCVWLCNDENVFSSSVSVSSMPIFRKYYLTISAVNCREKLLVSRLDRSEIDECIFFSFFCKILCPRQVVSSWISDRCGKVSKKLMKVSCYLSILPVCNVHRSTRNVKHERNACWENAQA